MKDSQYHVDPHRLDYENNEVKPTPKKEEFRPHTEIDSLSQEEYEELRKRIPTGKTPSS